MNVTVKTPDWEYMKELYDQHKTSVDKKVSSYQGCIALYVCGCILHGLTENQMVNCDSIYKDLYKDLYKCIQSNVPASNDYIMDLKDTYEDKMKRIVMERFDYKTPEMEANYKRMVKKAIVVDNSIFDEISDD